MSRGQRNLHLDLHVHKDGHQVSLTQCQIKNSYHFMHGTAMPMACTVNQQKCCIAISPSISKIHVNSSLQFQCHSVHQPWHKVCPRILLAPQNKSPKLKQDECFILHQIFASQVVYIAGWQKLYNNALIVHYTVQSLSMSLLFNTVYKAFVSCVIHSLE